MNRELRPIWNDFSISLNKFSEHLDSLSVEIFNELGITCSYRSVFNETLNLTKSISLLINPTEVQIEIDDKLFFLIIEKRDKKIMTISDFFLKNVFIHCALCQSLTITNNLRTPLLLPSYVSPIVKFTSNNVGINSLFLQNCTILICEIDTLLDSVKKQDLLPSIHTYINNGDSQNFSFTFTNLKEILVHYGHLILNLNVNIYVGNPNIQGQTLKPHEISPEQLDEQSLLFINILSKFDIPFDAYQSKNTITIVVNHSYCQRFITNYSYLKQMSK